MVEVFMDLPSFYSQVVKAGESADVDFPQETILTLTNATLGDLPADGSTDPIRLFADVTTVDLTIQPDGGLLATEKTSVLLACLIPGSQERQVLNATFSALNHVTLRVVGKADVHVAGILSPTDDTEYEEEEEEEEEGNEEAVKEEAASKEE